MQFDFEVAGRMRKVAVGRDGDRFIVTVDGRSWPVNAARVAPGALSLLIERPGLRTSYDITLSSDQKTGQLSVQVGTSTVAATWMSS